MTESDFEFYTCHSFVVNIMAKGTFEGFSHDHGSDISLGWTLPDKDHTVGISYIYFSEEIFSTDFNWKRYSYDSEPLISQGNFTKNPLTLPEVIFHEFGHGFSIYSLGSDYLTWNRNYKENWAIDFVNTRYRKNNSLPFEVFKSNWLQDLGIYNYFEKSKK